jgi:type II secretory pathway pseudopilin PulG
VVGIIAILAGIVIVAINPSKQIATVRNTQRLSDIKQINSALQQYFIDNGRYPTSTPATLTEICDTGDSTYPQNVLCGDSLIDLSILVPTYLAAMPVDPSGASSTLSFIPKAYAAIGGTGYKVIRSSTSGLISVGAPLAELGATIVLGKDAGEGGETGSTLSDGLVAHYLMNDDVTDNTGTYSAGTWSGGESYVDSVNVGMGKAMSLVGNNFVSLTGTEDIDFTGTFSVSQWIYTTSYGVGDVWERVFAANYTGPGWRLVVRGPNWQEGYLSICYGASCTETNAHVPLNTWSHVVWVIDNDSDTAHVYLNGELLDGDGVLNEKIENSGSVVQLGTYNSLDTGTWEGYIDDFRMYSRALTEPEITALAAGTEAE